ncbi:E3 ubiquitin-protein ligase TRIM39-like [Osmerus eperlanus]|uniref:E3 ubiquitin-protein ligase TRIM39-like n=1 Tax=Osmerus eperlanus TaxID=29151 RepID=UPI002E0D8488
MASAGVLLSEEQVQCSICLDVYTKPVSTPCGHNFCLTCIKDYWDTSDQYSCPLCKEKFNIRPKLRVNTFIAEMADQVKSLGVAEPTPLTQKQALNNPGLVSCDVCTGAKLKAVKSCLECQTSYCETHLEPHQIAPALKKHQLMDPVENLEDRVCQKHGKPLELFCRADQTCVCQFCTETDHKAHETVPIEEESEARKTQLRKMKVQLEEMIQGRQQKMKELQLSAETKKMEAEKDVEESRQVFTALMLSFERSQDELIEVIEEQQREVEKKTAEMIKELEQEITDLLKRSADLEELSHSEDHLLISQSLPALRSLPESKDRAGVRVQGDLCVEPVLKALSQLEKMVQEVTLPDIKLRWMKKCGVDVTLDPDTAHPDLILSADRRQVKLGETNPKIHDKPGRFDYVVCVLGKEGFSSGRFYYEVEVKEKTRWILGVAKESINRKGPFKRSPAKGHWAVGLMGDTGYTAHAGPDLPLSLSQKPQKVGVFVDYEGGEVTFYDVEARCCIYSFTGWVFREKMFPCFSTGLNNDGRNSGPLILSPVL